MKTVTLPIPVIGAIAGTRAILGLGLGLLLSSRVPYDRRRALGWTLFGIGVATTVPIAALVFRRRREIAASTSMTSLPA